MDTNIDQPEKAPSPQSQPEKSSEILPTVEKLSPTPAPAEKINPAAPAAPPSVNPPIGTPAVQPDQNRPVDNDMMSAADSDVIEKPWVDRAEKIIEDHQDDPYVEEKKEDELGRKYKKERFNIDVDEI